MFITQMERTSSFVNVSSTKRLRSPACTPTGYTPRQKKLCKVGYKLIFDWNTGISLAIFRHGTISFKIITL
jgi:hypothetical protein